MRKIFFLLIVSLQSFGHLAEEFKRVGYVEICSEKQSPEMFECLYSRFDELIAFLQTHPTWAHKLTNAKERFIRSKIRNYYSADFFGFYDESKKVGRSQISFYYSPHFHEFICSHYPEFKKVAEIERFFDACFEVQKPYGNLFEKIAFELGLEAIFSSDYGAPPILFKVIKYLPAYAPTRPHYDGSAFTLFLDSTDNESLLLSPYRPSFEVDDFSFPLRKFPKDSILLIPGALLAEFSIYPTPHIVVESGKIRYATIAFAMRPNYTLQKSEYSSLPNFRH